MFESDNTQGNPIYNERMPLGPDRSRTPPGPGLGGPSAPALSSIQNIERDLKRIEKKMTTSVIISESTRTELLKEIAQVDNRLQGLGWKDQGLAKGLKRRLQAIREHILKMPYY
jgi:hypothetical protein